MERISEIFKRKHIGTPTEQQVNTLTCIKNRLEKNDDRNSIKEQALELSGTPLWSEVVNLFKSEYPLEGVCDCGRIVGYVVHYYTLEEVLYCQYCAEKKDLQREQEQKEAYLKAYLERADSILKSNGTPKMFLKARITDFPKQAKRYVDYVKGLYIWGDRGTGKTHLAVALMREALKNINVIVRNGDYVINSRSVPCFISIPELLLEIRNSYSDGKSSEKLIIDKYTDNDFLVLDDLGVEKTSEWTMQILYIIVDRRYREEKKTIFTSNLSIEEISEKLDDRIASRIAGMCVSVPMHGADKRIANAKPTGNSPASAKASP